jgi:hypothetical protein
MRAGSLLAPVGNLPPAFLDFKLKIFGVNLASLDPLVQAESFVVIASTHCGFVLRTERADFFDFHGEFVERGFTFCQRVDDKIDPFNDPVRAIDFRIEIVDQSIVVGEQRNLAGSDQAVQIGERQRALVLIVPNCLLQRHDRIGSESP